MSDEIKTNNEEKETKCFCQSKGFRKFLVVALGSFVGVFCALSLFAALHKPPMMPPAPVPFFGQGGCPCRMIHQHKHHFESAPRGDRGNFQKFNKDIAKRAPFEAPRPQIND